MWILTRINLLLQYPRMKTRNLELLYKPYWMSETVVAKKNIEQELSTNQSIHQEYMPLYGYNALSPSNRGLRH